MGDNQHHGWPSPFFVPLTGVMSIREQLEKIMALRKEIEALQSGLIRKKAGWLVM